jgi:hypothetical protein
VTVWTVAISVSMMAIIAFTADAGRVLRARSDAFGTAAAAARFGASRIDEAAAVGQGITRLDAEAAVAAAEAYIADKGYEGEARVIGDLQVEVTVERDIDPNLPGVGPLRVEVTATAEAIQVQQ